LHAQRGNSVCQNSLRIQRQQLEQRLLSGLQDKVLREEFVDYVILARQEESQRRHEAFEWRLKALRDETQRIEAELKRLVERIAVGNGSPTIMAAITEREARLRGRSSPGRDQFKKNSMSYAPWRVRPQFMRRGLSWLS